MLDQTKIMEIHACIYEQEPDIIILNETWLKSTKIDFLTFGCKNLGVAESRSRCGPRVSDRHSTKCFPTVYIRLTTFQVDEIKASWPKIDF